MVKPATYQQAKSLAFVSSSKNCLVPPTDVLRMPSAPSGSVEGGLGAECAGGYRNGGLRVLRRHRAAGGTRDGALRV